MFVIFFIFSCYYDNCQLRTFVGRFHNAGTFLLTVRVAALIILCTVLYCSYLRILLSHFRIPSPKFNLSTGIAWKLFVCTDV
jgi:hypothetical protein